jgi:hypothetical protein
MNAALLILHVVMDPGIAAHGAQKLFGWFEGGRVKSSGAYGKSSNEFGLF